VCVGRPEAGEDVKRGRAPIRAQIARLQPQLNQLYARIQAILESGQQATQLSALAGKLSDQINQLNSDLLTLSPSKISPPYIAQDANLPGKPSSPNKALNPPPPPATP